MTRTWTKKSVATLTLLGLWGLGCGQSTVDDRFAGKPLLTIEGRMQDGLDSDTTRTKKPLKASLFWSRTGRFDLAEARNGAMVPDYSVVVAEEFPLTFRFHIFKAPKKELLINGKYAIGMILLYEDRMGQGRFVPGKTPIRGGAPFNAVFYAPERIESWESPIGLAIDAGMNEMQIPIRCNPQDEAAKKENEKTIYCERPLIGSKCESSKDCGPDGVCLKKVKGRTFPNGYCAVKKKRGGCVPVWTTEKVYKRNKKKWETFYMGTCDGDHYCRADEGYRCDTQEHFCLVPEPVVLDVTKDFFAAPLCFDRGELEGAGESSNPDEKNNEGADTSTDTSSDQMNSDPDSASSSTSAP